MDTVAAESTLKMLLNDRAILKQQLDEMRADPKKATDEAIKSVEEDIEIRTVQIQDLQTKILDADEGKINKFHCYLKNVKKFYSVHLGPIGKFAQF